MALRQNPRDKVLATPSSTAASLMSLQRPSAGGEDHKLICNLNSIICNLKWSRMTLSKRGTVALPRNTLVGLGPVL